MQADVGAAYGVVDHAVRHGIHHGPHLRRGHNIGVQNQIVVALHDLHNACAGGCHAHQADVHQPLHTARRVAVTVNQLIQYIRGIVTGGDGRNLLVGFDPPGGIGNVAFRQIGIHRNVNKAITLVRRSRLAAGGCNGLVQHFYIQLVTNRFHVAVLAVAQQVARAADL